MKSLSAAKSGCAGFTLVEILVAMTIFSFAVLALGAGTIGLIRNNQTSYLGTSAITLAQTKVEELRAMNTTTFAALACPSYTSTGCSDSPTASGKTFSRSWQITANSPVSGVNQIDVKVDWTDYTTRSMVVSASVAQ